MATFKAVVLKNKSQIKSDGTSRIKIRIVLNSKSAYIPTDLYVLVNDMNNKSGSVKKGPNADFINSRIATLLSQYQGKYMELRGRIEYMTVGQIKDFILLGKISNTQIDFFEFITEYIPRAKTKGTSDQYLFTMQSLKVFIGNSLPVSEITVNFLYRYEAWLRSNGADNGIVNYMTTFRSLFNKCREYYNNEDTQQILIPHYPFKKYNFPKRTVRSKHNVLTREELQSLINYDAENDGEQFARDMFLLMFYLIGIEAKDLFFLKKPKNGRVWYDRFKTNGTYSIKLEPEALEIINRYKGDKLLLNVSERFKHHKSFYRYINNYMCGEVPHNIKGIFPDKLKINKAPTTKWSRHSWATIARNKCRVNKDDVALCLGHKDLDNSVTDIYIEDDYTIIDESNRMVISYIN